MTKKELIQALAKKIPGLYFRDVECIVNAVFDEITKNLVDGNRVELRGFGVFSTRTREAKVGRNPKTKALVNVPAKKVPFFKVGKELRDQVKGRNK